MRIGQQDKDSSLYSGPWQIARDLTQFQLDQSTRLYMVRALAHLILLRKDTDESHTCMCCLPRKNQKVAMPFREELMPSQFELSYLNYGKITSYPTIH